MQGSRISMPFDEGTIPVSPCPGKSRVLRSQNMSNIPIDSVFVVLTDWRGRIVWRLTNDALMQIGDLCWTYLTPASQERTKELYGKVVTLRETQNLLDENVHGQHFRCWMWSLDSPEI